MADEFNSMQAQLGLVGQSGSFNPLGIPTPAPPAAPAVKHPGEISRDIVSQTQTAAMNTVQMANIARAPQMSIGQGAGMPAGVGMFAAQFQQNMAGIQANQLNPYSAQMMSAMTGVGGFNGGMFPNPTMMTAPGYGIYRPFMPPPPPVVSPFPQMPTLPTPFTPMPPPPMFQTPAELSNNIAIQAGQRRTAAMFAMPGAAARAAADIGLGYMGAGAGASIGAAFGPGGALIGGGIGAMAGLFAGENLGLASTAQHMVDRLNPFRTLALRSQQMMGMSQNFVTSGPDVNPFTGQGLSMQGSTHLARMLEDTAYNSAFRRETSARYSVQDLTRITNIAGQQGLLNDTQSVEQIHDRVKGIARMLTGFMKIANEPNVREALKQMGQMRTMGISFGEMMDTAMEMRTYARMAGTTRQGLMEAGGMPGAMVFQQAGLSAGLGMRVGAGALANANAAVASGSYTPRQLAMLGGVQGIAQQEMEASAAMLRMPMLSAAMGRFMPGGGFGVDPSLVAGLRNGRFNVNDMATMGANNLIAGVNSANGGVGAIAMAQLQAPAMQDQIGRMLGPQGLQMLRMQQVMQTAKLMGLDSNPGGYAIASQAMGFGSQLTLSDMHNASNPNYFRTLMQASRTREMEERGLAAEEFERTREGRISRAITNTDFGRSAASWIADTYSGFRNFGERAANFFGVREGQSQARDRGQVLLSMPSSLLASTPEEVRRMTAMTDREYRTLRSQAEGLVANYRPGDSYSRMTNADVWFGNADVRAQNAYATGDFLAGGYLEGAGNAFSKLMFDVDPNQRQELVRRDIQGASNMWARGSRLTSEERGGEISRLSKEQLISEGDVRKLVATTGRLLGNKALSGTSKKTFGQAEFLDVFKQAAQESGVDVSSMTTADRMAVGALARNQAAGIAALGGVNSAFEEFESIDVLGRDKTLGGLQKQQDMLTAAIFGKEGEGTDAFRGTRDERSKAFSALLGGKYSERAVLMAAYGAASGTDSRAKRAYDEYAAKYATDTKFQAEVAAYNKEVAGGGLSMRNALSKMGSRFALYATSSDEAEAGLANFRQQDTRIKYDASISEAKQTIFGDTANTDTGKLLEGDLTHAKDERIRSLMLEYQSTKDPQKKQQIVAQAEKHLLLQGAAQRNRAAGGINTPASTKAQKERAWYAKVADQVSEFFGGGETAKTPGESAPNLWDASERLQRASATLEGAASALSNILPGTALPPDHH